MEESSELKQLKSELRALVVSSPTQVDMRQLLRDFRSLTGAPLPITKFGYRDPVQFLRERCSDSFLLQGPLSNPQLILIVPETIKHIDDFVRKQKLSSNKFKGPKRRSVPESFTKGSSNLIAQTFTPRPQPTSFTHQQQPASHTLHDQRNGTSATIRNAPVNAAQRGAALVASTPHREGVHITERPSRYVPPGQRGRTEARPMPADGASVQRRPAEQTPVDGRRVERTPSKLTPVDERTVQRSPSKPTLVDSKKMQQSASEPPAPKPADGAGDGVQSDEVTSSVAYKNFMRRRVPQFDSTLALDDASETLSSCSSSKQAQLEELKAEVRQLVADAADGVWAKDLLRRYRERFDRELDFARFGFTSVLGLATQLGDGVALRRDPAHGLLLLQARLSPSPPPKGPLNPPAGPPFLRARRPRSASPPPTNAEDALPGIDFDPDVFPADCVQYSDSIPPATLDGLEPGAMVEVMVGEVYSPSHFWLIRLGEDHHIAMEETMDRMTEYYEGPGRERTLALGAVRVGHYCSSFYERDWHRSIIVRLLDDDMVKVRHVDYGTVERTPVHRLKPLRSEWARLPAQAVRARLAGVRPGAGARAWPHAAALHFLRLVQDRPLVANVIAVDHEERVVEVCLVDTATERDVRVDRALVAAGYADARHDSALKTTESHLWPRFGALEEGATPNFADIHAYLRDGIELEFVEDYRRHVPVRESASACAGAVAAAEPARAAPSLEPPPHRDFDNRVPLPLLSLLSVQASPIPSPSPSPSPPPSPSPSSSASSSSATSRSPSPAPAPASPSPPALASPSPPCTISNPRPPRPAPAPAPMPAPAPAPAQPQPQPQWQWHNVYRPQHPQMLHPVRFAPFFPMPSPPFVPMSGPPMAYPAMGPCPLPAPLGFRFAQAPAPAAFSAPRPPTPRLPNPRPSAPAPQTPPPAPRPTQPTAPTNPTPPTSIVRPATPPFPTKPARSPPPPYNGTGAPAAAPAPAPAPSAPQRFVTSSGVVVLSVSECEIYSLLSRVDPNAAHWYMVDAISRARHSTGTGTGCVTSSATTSPVSSTTASAPSTLNPHAAEFQATAAAPLRPPPGLTHPSLTKF